MMKYKMAPNASGTISHNAIVALLVGLAWSIGLTSAILVQPYNYMLDDSSLVGPHQDAGSLSPFYNDQSGASEQSADKDIVGIIGDRLARLRFARMLAENQDEAAAMQSHFSQEMAELIQSEQQQQQQQGKEEAAAAAAAQEPSLSSSVASLLLDVAQAATGSNQENQQHHSAATADADQQQQQQTGNEPKVSSRGSIIEMDTSASSSPMAGPSSAISMPSKADLKHTQGPIQWFNPKETIPILKISSMATPSKYKKVYFRSEKKLVDGAFHSPSIEQEEKKSLLKSPFLTSGVQRRSSRGTGSSAAPPSPLQDGVIDFLKKFRDVYIQTRPVNPSSGSSAASNLASSMVSAAASSPFASVLAPPSSGSRPNFASALQAATSMVAQATSSSSSPSSSSSSSSSSSPTSGSAASNSPASVLTGSSSSSSSSTNPNKSPLSAQSYVSFWSKTFPTWVRKTLKQLRRRSLYNSSRRQQKQQQQQHQHHHSHSHSGASRLGQAAQAAASVASAVDQATSGGSGSGSNSQSSSSH